jgi:hypothetical protein
MKKEKKRIEEEEVKGKWMVDAEKKEIFVERRSGSRSNQ